MNTSYSYLLGSIKSYHLCRHIHGHKNKIQKCGGIVKFAWIFITCYCQKSFTWCLWKNGGYSLKSRWGILRPDCWSNSAHKKRPEEPIIVMNMKWPGCKFLCRIQRATKTFVVCSFPNQTVVMTTGWTINASQYSRLVLVHTILHVDEWGDLFS